MNNSTLHCLRAIPYIPFSKKVSWWLMVEMYLYCSQMIVIVLMLKEIFFLSKTTDEFYWSLSHKSTQSGEEF